MQDRFKFRLIVEKGYKTINGSFKGIQVYYCNGFIQGKAKTMFFGNGKRYSFLNSQIKHINQCTGLKDKNGNLIYEGNVVNLYVTSKKVYRYQVKNEIGSFMLVSQNEIFDFPKKWNDNVYPLSQLYFEYENAENFINQCEIIGNIYENPELLSEVE